MDLIPSPLNRLGFHLLRHDDNAVHIGKDQVAGTKANARYFDGDTYIDDTLPILAVVGTGAASEHGNVERYDVRKVSNQPVDDEASDAAMLRLGCL